MQPNTTYGSPEQIGATDMAGRAPLHVAAFDRDLPVLRRLLRALAAHSDRTGIINARDALGNTPLSAAVQRDWLEGAQALLSAGADVSAVDARGRSPLVHAAALGNGWLVQCLLTACVRASGCDSKLTGMAANRGANPRQADSTGSYPYDYAKVPAVRTLLQ
jgi:ankyrin repeat protein